MSDHPLASTPRAAAHNGGPIRQIFGTTENIRLPDGCQIAATGPNLTSLAADRLWTAEQTTHERRCDAPIGDVIATNF
jgi:hypothetical protein